MSATTTHGVKCGNCKNYHESAVAVKACYEGQRVGRMLEAPKSVFDLPIAERWGNKQLDENAGQVVTYPHSQPPTKYEPKRGDVHFISGEYYRVHESQGTGRHYACRWDGERFDYDRGAIRKLNASTIITAEQAKAFGDMTERCVFCSTKIDTPESTAVGYGPVCASKHGLPWG